MPSFNSENRTRSVVKSSGISSICNIVNIIAGFVFRTVFVRQLSAEYLGINGLFTNILAILSLTELGISTAILFRCYEPISRGDVQKVGQIMRFFKQVYLLIAAAIFVLGLILSPFLGYFIKDSSEIPADVNIYIVYALFLAESISSYLWSYKLSILEVDRKQYALSVIRSITIVSKYVSQLLVLLLTHNYVFTLAIGIISTIVLNLIFSFLVSRRYRSVFSCTEMLPAADRKQIFDDTKATLCHKIGGTVVFSTDNIILSAFIGLRIAGFYANYSMIIRYLQSVIKMAMGSFTANLGNSHVTLSKKQNYEIFKKLEFINLWLSGVTTVCLYLLIDGFISVWVGNEMLMDSLTVSVLCAQFFFESSRQIMISFTNGSGLFVKDKARPFIEAAINIFVSIVLAFRIGLAGVFIGTLISYFSTVFWREPLLLFKYEFDTDMHWFWSVLSRFTLMTAVSCVVIKKLCLSLNISAGGLAMWLVEAICAFVIINLLFALIFHNCEEYVFLKSKLKTAALSAAKKLREYNVFSSD